VLALAAIASAVTYRLSTRGSSARTDAAATSQQDEDKEYRHKGVVLDADILKVEMEDRGSRVLFVLTTLPDISPSVEVDYNQNGAVDPGLDRAYSAFDDGRRCTVLMLDLGGSTRCGEFTSEASVTVYQHIVGTKLVKQINWLIPKRELSGTSTTAHVIFRLADERVGLVWRFFPSDSFRQPLKLRYY
jgi:hypothetical protein